MKYINDVKVFCIARTRVNRAEVRQWLNVLGANEFDVPSESAISDPALLVALAAKQCYMSFQPGLNPNVTKVRADLVEYLDNILAQRHGSVLEHATFTFAIDGCSRVFTAEMNRHRAGVAISERSMRYVRLDDLRFWMPTCFQDDEHDSEELRDKKRASRVCLEYAFEQMERTQQQLAFIWADELAPESTFHAKKTLTSAFRRAVGMGVATGGVWTMNIRALRHIVALRTDPSAEEEMAHIMHQIGRYMIHALPELMGDFSEHQDHDALVPKYPKV